MKSLSDEPLPILRALQVVAPRVAEKVIDPFGRFAPFWQWQYPEKTEEEKPEELGYPYAQIEIVPALPPPRPIVTVREIIPIEKPKPEVAIEL